MASGRRTVTVELPELLPVAALSESARALIVSHDEQKRSVTLSGRPDMAVVEALVASLEKEESREILRAAIAELVQHERVMLSPAERGERFAVPQMMLELDGAMVRPDEAEWLESGWRLPLPPREGDAPILDTPPPADSVGFVDVEDGKVARLPLLAGVGNASR